MVTNDEKQEFSDRLNLVLDKAGVPPKGKGRQGLVAKAFGVSQKGARKWLEGEAIPETKRIKQFIELYKNYGITGEWLLHGNLEYAPSWVKSEGANAISTIGQKIESNAEFIGGIEEWDNQTPLRDDEVELPFFREVKLSAGSGKSHVEENHGAKLRFLKSTLKGHVSSLNSAACVKVSGNSMEPVFPDGSTVGIDTANTAIKDGEIYAIDYNGHLLIKAIYRVPSGGIRLKSFNTEEWPDEPVTEDKMELLRILGRVFWCSWLR